MGNGVQWRHLGLVGCALALVAGDAGRAYREGKDLDEAGSDYKAAVKYLEALREDSGHKKALEALRAGSHDAYAEHLKDAQDAEATKAFPEALGDYKDLVVLVKGLNEFEAAGFEIVDLGAKVTEMTTASAEAAYVRAGTAFTGSHWEAAITACGEATSFVSNYKDCGEKTATAYYKWAEADVAGKKFRDGVGHYTASAKAGAGTDAEAKAAAIQLALAKYFLEKGACRQAVGDATASGKLAASAEADQVLASANACAQTPIAMAAIENPTGVNPAGMAVADVLADAILNATGNGASKFLTIVDRGTLDGLLAEQGISISPDATPKGVKGLRYLILGKITVLRVETVPPTPKATTATATQMYDCPKQKSDGTTVMARCPRDVQVIVDRYTGSSTASLTLSLRVVDVSTGTQVAIETIQAEHADQVAYAQNLRFAGGGPVGISMDGRDGTVTNTEIRKALEARQTLAPDAELLKAVLQEVSKKGSAVILAKVDKPAVLPDPTTLTVP
jgi:curli biogenesis system outer membrane secretion channel CsgG